MVSTAVCDQMKLGYKFILVAYVPSKWLRSPCKHKFYLYCREGKPLPYTFKQQFVKMYTISTLVVTNKKEITALLLHKSFFNRLVHQW